MKRILICLSLLTLLFGLDVLEAQPLLPNPAYGLQDAINWDLQYANGDQFGTGIEDGTPYEGTTTMGFMEGVPNSYTWYLPDARPQAIQPPSTWNSSFIGATSLHAYDQIYKFNGIPAHPNCRIELGPMRFMVHLISSGQWVELSTGPLGGAAFVEDFDNNESTGPDTETWTNGIFSVRSGIGNAFPSDPGGPGGVDSRGVGFMFHGFPSPQPTISGTLSSIDAALAFQQIRCVGPDAQYTPYLCNVGIDYAEETGVSGGLFVPATTNWQWYTCYVGPVSEISSIPEPNANYVFISSISVSPATVSIAGGASAQLSATVTPSNASDAGIKWFSSNTNVVYVNPVSGVITGFGQGTATISATAQENVNTLANCTVTVTSAPPWTVVNLGNSSDGATYNDNGFFWHDVQAIGQDLRFMNETGGTAQYQFTGTGVDVIGKLFGTESPSVTFTISIDGTVRVSGNNASPNGADVYEAVLGSVTGLSNGSHTVTITETSGGNYASFLLVDALRIYGSTTIPVTGVSVSPSSLSLGVGGTRQLTSTVTPANASNPNVTWSSGNGAVATVNTSGLVTGTGAGTVTISATTQSGGYVAYCSVTVTNTAVSVTGVSVSPTSASVAVGATTQLTATVSPSNASNQNVSWTSSNTGVATVSSSGLVTGVAAGSATITVTTQDGGKAATSAITVTNGASSTIVNAGNASDGITYSGGWFNTRTGDINNDERMMNSSSCYAQYTFTGTGVDVIGFLAGGSSYAANYTIYVDGNSVATGNTTSSSDQYQVVLGSASGLSNGSHTVKIAFTSGIGSSPYVILDAFRIYSGSTVAVTGVSVSPTSASVAAGSTTQLTATVSPSNASNQNVSWTSSNTGVATVSSSGLVTGVAAGSATITVTTQDGGKTATSAITVTTANVPVTGVSVSPTSASVAAGSTTQLTATVSPSNASNQNVSWSSSNTGVATVSSSGLVTGVAAGSATITVTTQDGGKTATSAITVTTSSGTDLALNKSYAAGSANYSSIGLAFDGNTSTGVSSTENYGGNGILAADLGATTTISKVTVTFNDVSAYQVQGSSDGTNWSNIGAKVTSPANPNTTTYSGVSYRYVRVVFDPFYVGGVGYFNPGIDEIGVY